MSSCSRRFGVTGLELKQQKLYSDMLVNVKHLCAAELLLLEATAYVSR